MKKLEKLHKRCEGKMQTNLNNTDIENLDRILMCAEWLVGQFESIHCESIANIFRRAIDDANAWINNMVANENMPETYCKNAMHREAEIIHSILIRYASISDPKIKEEVLSDMISAIEGKK